MSSKTFTEQNTVQTEKVAAFARLWWVGLLTIVVATVVNVVLTLIADAVFAIPAAFLPLAPGAVGTFTFIGVLGAVIVFALLGAFTRRPLRLFRIVTIVILVLSIIPDFVLLMVPAFPATTVAGVSILIFLHIVAAAICFGMLTTLGRARA